LPSTIESTDREAHVAGEKLFVGFAGDTVPAPPGASTLPPYG
jgi:hypothetical protein